MNIKTKLVAGFVLGVFAVSVFAPSGVFAKVTIKNNGYKSKNYVVKHNKNVRKVEQRNKTNAKTGISITSKTGWNSVNKNTGEEASIETGNSKVTTSVDVNGGYNENTDNSEGCCCACGETENLIIKDNGDKSNNKIYVNSECINVVEQSNLTTSHTFINTYSNTGGNEANGNTNGSTSIATGNSTVSTAVYVAGGENINN